MQDTSMSGLTAKEAQEFHAAFMQGVMGFFACNLVAHILVWIWRPWF